MIEKYRQACWTFLELHDLVTVLGSIEEILIPLLHYTLSVKTWKKYMEKQNDKDFISFKGWIAGLDQGRHLSFADMIAAPAERISEYHSILQVLRYHTMPPSPSLDRLIKTTAHFMEATAEICKTDFERKKVLIKVVNKCRIEKLQQSTQLLITTNPNLCETLVQSHQEYWLRRIYAIHTLKEFAKELNNMRLGLNITKVVTSGAGMTIGGIAVASVILPILIPVAIAGGVTVGVSSLATIGIDHLLAKLMQDKISTTLMTDKVSSVAFEESLRQLLNEIEVQRMQQEKIPDNPVSHADVINDAFIGTGAAVTAGRIVFNIADIAGDPLIAVGRFAGGIAGGVGILVDSVSMGLTIYDMVKEGSKHTLTKYVEQCIELMEIEMEAHARLVIPLKYQLMRRRIEKVMNMQDSELEASC